MFDQKAYATTLHERVWHLVEVVWKEADPPEVVSPLATRDRVGLHDARWLASDLGCAGVLLASFDGGAQAIWVLRSGNGV